MSENSKFKCENNLNGILKMRDSDYLMFNNNNNKTDCI